MVRFMQSKCVALSPFSTLICFCSKLQSTGQKVGAAAAVCHLKKEDNHYSLSMANVGDVEVVVCRRGEVVPISRRFLVQSDHQECNRICKSDGIITEVGFQTWFLILCLREIKTLLHGLTLHWCYSI